MKHLLLLEDDEVLGRGIAMALESAERTVTRCASLAQGNEVLKNQRFDLLILDVNLPDGSGLNLLRSLRSRDDHTPVILLTANDLELDEVTGLESGADDYITKPFSLAVLRARVAVQLRREPEQRTSVMTLGPFSFDFDRMDFRRDGAAVGSYDKVQLPLDEAWQIAPGDSLPVFDLDFGRVGLAICYDMMFPEILSVLGLRGARIVFHPTAGYGWYDSIGEATLRTRANDNDLYIVTAKSYVYAAAGHSSVIDHWGQVKADAGFDADVVVSHCIDLDQEKVQPPWFVPTRMTGEPSLRRRRALERRPALYAPLADERLAGRLVQPEEEKPSIVEDLRSGRVHW